ncbi:hypothetical protein Q5752_002546 [Cryptotrichosporon argae]
MPASPTTPKRSRTTKSYADAPSPDADAAAASSASEGEPELDGLDIKPDPESDSEASPRKKPKASPSKKRASPSATLASPRKPKGPKGAGSAAKWTPDEDWAMFRSLHPKVDKPAWAALAAAIGNGRDAKSCQNRYAVMSKRLEAAIKSISAGA